MLPLMIWRDWTLCPDLEAQGARLPWLDHTCHLRSSNTLQRRPACADQSGCWYRRGAWVLALPLPAVGPWTCHSPSVFPASGDKDSTTSRDCCPCCPQKSGFVIKSCLTWRHSGSKKQKWTKSSFFRNVGLWRSFHSSPMYTYKENVLKIHIIKIWLYKSQPYSLNFGLKLLGVVHTCVVNSTAKSLKIAWSWPACREHSTTGSIPS